MSDDTRQGAAADAQASLATARRSAEIMLGGDACTRMLGIDVEIPQAGQAVARMLVRDDMLNAFGVCHGGVVFTLADTAFAFACNAYNEETLSATAGIEWLEPVRAGDRLVASAREDERRGRHGFYTVRVCNQDEVLVALFRGRAVGRGRPLFPGGDAPRR